MAVGEGSSGPDFGAMLSLNNFSNQAGIKPAPLLLFIPGCGVDTDVLKGLSCKGERFEKKVIPLAQGKKNWVQRLGASFRDSVSADCGKANKEGAVTQMAFNQADPSSITGPTFPRGGGSDFGLG